ncbi:hypothetical protein [Halocella sp. SP3-1]|nr:hypothetical protein [Halocella sp. SP3-1]
MKEYVANRIKELEGMLKNKEEYTTEQCLNKAIEDLKTLQHMLNIAGD